MRVKSPRRRAYAVARALSHSQKLTIALTAIYPKEATMPTNHERMRHGGFTRSARLSEEEARSCCWLESCLNNALDAM